MTVYVASDPFDTYLGLTGLALNGGFVYIGVAGSDPESSPQACYWDVAGTVPAAQPISVLGGYTMHLGSPARVYTARTYSMRVRDSSGVQVFYEPNANPYVLAAADITFIPGTTGSVNRDVQAKLRDYLTVLDYGADPTGAASSVAAIAAAAAVGPVIFPPGTYLIDANATVAAFVKLTPGAKFSITTTKTLTLNGGFEAPRAQVFLNALATQGTVVIGAGTILEGYPEWWGAAIGGADCFGAITACMAACDTTRLGAGDYFTSATLKMIRGHTRLVGAGSEWESGNTSATRLLVTSASLNTLQVGPDAAPVDINHFQKQNEVKDLYVSRNVAPLISSACGSIRAQYVIYAHIENVKTNESMIGFDCYGTVRSIFERCSAVRESAGTGGGTDSWKGFYANGAASIGAAGGNASLYWNFCSASCNNPALTAGANAHGFYADVNFTDLFIESPETVSCVVGINIQGNTSGTVATNTDCQIKNPTNDAFTKNGILINNVNPEGSVEIIGGYYGAAAGATQALLISTSYGVAVKGGEFVMLANATCTAIGVTSSHGVAIERPLILEASVSAVVLNGSSNCDVRPLIKNYLNTMTGPAVQLTNTSTRNYVQPLILGAAGKVPIGVRCDAAADGFNEVNCSLMDPACITGGSANKLVSPTGTQVVAAGVFNTNCLASGIMA